MQISFVIPCYNSEAYLVEAVESVLNQTFRDFELILVDDGSTDSTVSIIQDFMAKDERVRLLQNQHGGASAARNAGIEAANAEWVALLDSDDVCLPERLQRQVEAMQADPEVICWGTSYRIMGSDGTIQPGVKTIGPSSKEAFYKLRENHDVIYMPTNAVLFRRDIALKIGGMDTRLVAAEDTDFFTRMSQHGPMVTLIEPLVMYRLHERSLTARSFSQQYINSEFLDKRAEAWRKGETLDYDEFLTEYNSQGTGKRILRHLDKLSKLNYRNASINVGRGHYPKAVLYMVFAVILNPGLILGRIARRLALITRDRSVPQSQS